MLLSKKLCLQFFINGVYREYFNDESMRTPPFKVFTFSSRSTAGMAAKNPSTRNRRRMLKVNLKVPQL